MIPLLAIVGPTAVGKTALSLHLARVFNGEIVSADSRQVYRWMDIGTAKPTPAERAAAPHHLIDVVDPDEEFSLALYQDMATAAIADIAARGSRRCWSGEPGSTWRQCCRAGSCRASPRALTFAPRLSVRRRNWAQRRSTNV